MNKKDASKEGARKKILIVDDDPVTLKILEKILFSADYRVAKATNGKEALCTVEDFNPDLIILDILMPVMDGTETIRILEKNPRTKNIPVLFLTSLISKSEESNKFAMNRCFLAKPIDRDKLLKEIERHV